MYKKILTRFFKDNAVFNSKIPSAFSLAHFQIKLLKSKEASGKFEELFDDMILKDNPERKKTVLEEKGEIIAASTCAQIIHFMRRHPDPMNQPVLVNQAMQFEEEIIPEVARMLKTSLNSGFIETATRILSLCSKEIADELIGYFEDVRSPYAQAMILLILGFKADETYIPWIVEKYSQLKKHYPNESYSDGAYYALYEIEDRFYITQ